MPSLLTSLLIGISILSGLFWLLRRISHWSVATISMALCVFMIMVYGIYVSRNWEGMDVLAIHLALFLLTIYINSLLAMQRDNAGKTKWHWAPGLLIGFFVFVIVINTVFVSLATYGTDSSLAHWFLPKPRSGVEVHSVFPGVVSHDYREKEELYNQYLLLREQQSQRGWQVSVGWEELPHAGQPAQLLLRIVDKDKQPVVVDRIEAKLHYIADSRLDQMFTMHISAQHLYSASLDLPRPGRWELVLMIHRGNDQHEVRAVTEVLADIKS